MVHFGGRGGLKTGINTQAPSISLLFKFLQSSLNELEIHQKLVNNQQEKLAKSNDLSAEELKELCSTHLNNANATITISQDYEHTEQQRIAQLRLQDLISNNYSSISRIQCFLPFLSFLSIPFY